MDVIGGKHVKSIMTKYLDAFGDENNSDNSIGEVTKPLLKVFISIYNFVSYTYPLLL